MKITIENIDKDKLDAVVAELDRLSKRYGIKINELGGFAGNEDDRFDKEAIYYFEEKKIELNTDYVNDLLLEDDVIEERKKYKIRIDRRRKMGIIIDNDMVWENVRSLLSTVRHEFFHAIEYRYKLDKDRELLRMYNSLTEEEITTELCSYANTDVSEFLAVAYEESYYDDATDLAKLIRRKIDERVFKNEYI